MSYSCHRGSCNQLGGEIYLSNIITPKCFAAYDSEMAITPVDSPIRWELQFEYILVELHMQEIYDDMWSKSIDLVRRGDITTDPLIDDVRDTRRGLTILVRPSQFVLDRFCDFMYEAEKFAQHQFYTELEQIHVTVMSIVSCVEGFRLDDTEIQQYVSEISKSLKDIEPFEIQFQGVTASPSCVLAQGFPNNNTLVKLRDRLRIQFRNSGLRCSIDERYRISTAHSTLIRFRHELTHATQLAEFLEKSRALEFGLSPVSHVSLILNDWYHRGAVVRTLQRFTLGS